MAAKKKTQQKTNTRKKTARKPAGRVASTSAKRDEYTAVLEDLRAQFATFGESLALTREVLSRDIEELKESMKRIEERMQKVEMRMQKMEDRMQKMEDRMQKSEERIFYLERANLELLKEIREHTISRSEFEELREKVRKLEAKQS